MTLYTELAQDCALAMNLVVQKILSQKQAAGEALNTDESIVVNADTVSSIVDRYRMSGEELSQVVAQTGISLNVVTDLETMALARIEEGLRAQL